MPNHRVGHGCNPGFSAGRLSVIVLSSMPAVAKVLQARPVEATLFSPPATRELRLLRTGCRDLTDVYWVTFRWCRQPVRNIQSSPKLGAIGAAAALCEQFLQKLLC